MTKHALAIRHIHFENLGILEPVLKELDFNITYVEAPTTNLAAINAQDPALLIVLGAPIGAFDEETYPFLEEEMALIKSRLDSGKPLLGICLGAQLMSRLLGGKVQAMPNHLKEIGFAPIRLSPQGQESPLAALGTTPVLHWHGDQFEIPSNAIRLAETGVCPNQAFSVGSNVLGLQFHMEADPSKIEAWLVGHACELATNRINIDKIRKDAQKVSQSLPAAGAEAFRSWVAQWDVKKK